MDLKQQILHLYRVDELSLREIARRTGTDRKTVTRLINAYEADVKADPDTGIDEFLATRPKYTSRKYAPRVMRDAVAKEIDRCLKENDRRRGNGMRKQCLKNTDIHRQLMEKGSGATENKPRMLEEEIKALKPYPGERCNFAGFFRRQKLCKDSGPS